MRRNIAPIVVVGLEQLEINDSATILDAQIDILTCRGVNEVQRLDRECKYYEVMSNADRIKNMSVEELANFILTISDDEKSFSKIINGEEIYGSVCEVMQWLESEVTDYNQLVC